MGSKFGYKFGIFRKCLIMIFRKDFGWALCTTTSQLSMYRKLGYILSDKKNINCLREIDHVFESLCLGHCVWSLCVSCCVQVAVLRLLAFWFLKSKRASWSYFLLCSSLSIVISSSKKRHSCETQKCLLFTILVGNWRQLQVLCG